MTENDLKKIRKNLEQMVGNLFLTEPLIFAAYCTHDLVINPKILVPFRSGKMRIEYNPEKLAGMKFEDIEEALKTEITRILLKHPYSRKPEPFIPDVAIQASDVTIKQELAEEYSVPPHLSYEQYYSLLSPDLVRDDGSLENGSAGDEAGEGGSVDQQMQEANCFINGATGLWEENEIAREEINNLIRTYKEQGKGWGGIKGFLKEQIVASVTSKIDYLSVLRSFRASVLSDKKSLTRFRPSRRFGFDYMGSKREFTTKLLVAIDTSASIMQKDLQNFFGIINRFFKYGIEIIDVINFDCDLQGNPVSFSKHQKDFTVTGRGGTDFQPVFDYVGKHPEYDGVLIFTDGEASPPKKKPGTRTKFVWVLRSKSDWENNHEWMETIGKSCYLTE